MFLAFGSVMNSVQPCTLSHQGARGGGWVGLLRLPSISEVFTHGSMHRPFVITSFVEMCVLTLVTSTLLVNVFFLT